MRFCICKLYSVLNSLKPAFSLFLYLPPLHCGHLFMGCSLLWFNRQPEGLGRRWLGNSFSGRCPSRERFTDMGIWRKGPPPLIKGVLGKRCPLFHSTLKSSFLSIHCEDLWSSGEPASFTPSTAPEDTRTSPAQRWRGGEGSPLWEIGSVQVCECHLPCSRVRDFAHLTEESWLAENKKPRPRLAPGF